MMLTIPFPESLDRLKSTFGKPFVQRQSGRSPKFSREFGTLDRLNSDFSAYKLQNSLENFRAHPTLSSSMPKGVRGFKGTKPLNYNKVRARAERVAFV